MNILNELKIGNIVYRTIEETVEHRITADDFIWCRSNPENYTPIKLTPEWILKAGFVKKEKSPVEYELKISNNLVYEIRWNRLSQEIHSIGVVIYSVEGKREGMVNFAWHIEYVHSFQNIMFEILKREIYQ